MPKRTVEINLQALLNKVEQTEERKTVSLYLSAAGYEAFKAACGSAPPSRVIEEFMKAFVTSATKPKS